MKGVYVFLADGFEDIEAIAPVDILLRGGVAVKTVSLNEDYFATSSHRIPMVAKMNLEDFRAELFRQESAGVETSPEDFLIFPGGMPGSKNLADCKKLMTILEMHYEAGGSVGAICAAPAVVLAPHIAGVRMTCYDGFGDALKAGGNEYDPEDVVEDGRVITGKGPGLAIEFGLRLLAAIKGEEAAAAVAAGMML